MSGEFTGEAERIMVSLDAVGNTTKAITKGVAIGSAVIASVSLFGSFVETIASQLGLHLSGSALFTEHAHADKRGQPDDLHRAADRWLGGVLVLVAGDPGRGPVRGDRGAGGAAAVPGAPRDHGLHGEAGVRPGHLDLHGGGPARARDAGAAGRAHPGDRGLRDQLLRSRRLPGRRDPDRPADGQLPVQLGWGVGQRQEVHRGRPRGRQGIGGAQGGRDRRHHRRPLQGHRRAGAQPADQGHEPGVALDPAGRDHASAPQRRPARHRRRCARGPARGDRLLQETSRGASGPRRQRSSGRPADDPGADPGRAAGRPGPTLDGR